MLDIVSYMLGKKSGGGGGLPSGITELNTGQMNMSSAPIMSISSGLTAPKNVVVWRSASDPLYELVAAKFYDASNSSYFTFGATASTVGTADKVHFAGGSIIVEPVTTSVRFDGTYNWIAWS